MSEDGGSEGFSRERALRECRREREFYKYYEAIKRQSLLEPTFCDLSGDTKGHRPVSSPDKALTAFCQLGALRLRAKRAMLWFFDVNHTYCLAEATQSLSLQDDSKYDEGDGLWLGYTYTDRGTSVCERTVCLPVTRDRQLEKPVHVIKDLRKDARVCGLPYVKNNPDTCFYAGVPLTNSRGINVGAYCIFDDHGSREDLDDKEIAFMEEMSVTIMTYLETIRAKCERERGIEMVNALGTFVEGASGVRERKKRMRKYARRKSLLQRFRSTETIPSYLAPADDRSPHSQSATETSPQTEPHNPLDSGDDLPRRERSSTETEALSPLSMATPTVLKPADDYLEAFDSETHETASPAKPAGSESTSTPSEAMKDLHDQIISPEVRNAFQRAADLVRAAVEVDGTIFLDGSVGTFGGLVEEHSAASDDGASGDYDTGSSEGEHSRSTSEDRRAEDKACFVLGSSYAPGQPGDHLAKGGQHLPIKERFLRYLLRKYGHGHIWNFDNHGYGFSDDDMSDVGSDYTPSDPKSGQSTEDEPWRQKMLEDPRVIDGRKIQRLFPGVCSFALVGVWDQSTGRWFAACALWAYSPLRVLSTETEINYVAAFCDVLMAEVKRLEIQQSDRRKSDFVSSISHELRSPLHGILGSVECLQEEDMDEHCVGLLSQIETCGRSLLDIIDHLLDFTNINFYASGSETQAQRRRVTNSDIKRDQLGGMISLNTDISLDEVTEEVVESAVYSFYCRRATKNLNDHKMTVILDIDSPGISAWKCRLPVGGWKRICINLVTNALKYTSNGYAEIGIRAVPKPQEPGSFNAVFRVSDSGRGMSKTFVDNHLYEAFTQENSINDGLGLGMSLMHRIVETMGGKVECQSQKGVGTTMTVTVPLECSQEESETEDTALASKEKNSFKGITIGLFQLRDPDQQEDSNGDVPSIQDKGIGLLNSSIENACRGLGATVIPMHTVRPVEADLSIITEADLFRIERNLEKGNIPRLVIVLSNSVQSRRPRHTLAVPTDFGSQYHYVALPCGPIRLAKAIRTSLATRRQHPRPDSTQETEQETAASQAVVRQEPSEQTTTAPPPEEETKTTTILDVSQPDPATQDIHGPPEVAATNLAVTDSKPSTSGYLLSKPDTLVEKPISTSSTPSNNLCLLLVDDNPINLQLLVTYAKKFNYNRIMAKDGQEALDAYTTAHQASIGSPEARMKIVGDTIFTLSPGRPDVVLMDINMPVMDGFESTRRIRAYEQQNGVEPVMIIALTGLGSATAQQEAFSSGIDLFLTKPVRLKELTKILDSVKAKNRAEGGPESSSS